MLFLMSECVSPVKTGRRTDVAGALPAALRREALDVRVLLFGVARRHHAPGNVAAELMQGLSTQILRLWLHPQRPLRSGQRQ
jgi:glycogen synthase